MKASDLKNAVNGKWVGIFSHFGIQVNENGKHSPCPYCGGVDRFRLTKIDEGRWYCNQCDPSAGDGIGLVQKCTGKTFPETLKAIADIMGLIEPIENKKTKRIDPKKILNKVWSNSKINKLGDMVSEYLKARGIHISAENIMFNPKCYEGDSKQNYPAMVARVQNAAGKPVGIHRTFLDGAKKLDIDKPKKLLPATESLNGSAIRLAEVGETIGIAEGVETALSCMQMFNMPVWAVLSTAIMESFLPPDSVKNVIIFSDNDKNFAGQKSAYKLANNLYNKKYVVDVQIPEKKGYDFNDVLMENISKS